MDARNHGGGRWRLCTDAIVVETSAWCEWDQQRAQVLAVSGLPGGGPVVAYDMWVAFALAQIQVGVTYFDRGGAIATYAAPFGLQAGALDADRLGGVLAFTVALQVDPETGPMAEVPTQYHGLIRWRCGDPPPA
jgi:hypothetical protein